MITRDMTAKDFRAVKLWDAKEDIGLFDSLVIVPARTARDLHDSSYRCMGFVAVRNDEPVCFLSGYSDVLHIDGIGGTGNQGGYTPRPPKGWNIDCLPKSGLLNLFCYDHKLRLGLVIYSSFEIVAVKEGREKVSTDQVELLERARAGIIEHLAKESQPLGTNTPYIMKVHNRTLEIEED